MSATSKSKAMSTDGPEGIEVFRSWSRDIDLASIENGVRAALKSIERYKGWETLFPPREHGEDIPDLGALQSQTDFAFLLERVAMYMNCIRKVIGQPAKYEPGLRPVAPINVLASLRSILILISRFRHQINACPPRRQFESQKPGWWIPFPSNMGGGEHPYEYTRETKAMLVVGLMAGQKVKWRIDKKEDISDEEVLKASNQLRTFLKGFREDKDAKEHADRIAKGEVSDNESEEESEHGLRPLPVSELLFLFNRDLEKEIQAINKLDPPPDMSPTGYFACLKEWQKRIQRLLPDLTAERQFLEYKFNQTLYEGVYHLALGRTLMVMEAVFIIVGFLLPEASVAPVECELSNSKNQFEKYIGQTREFLRVRDREYFRGWQDFFENLDLLDKAAFRGKTTFYMSSGHMSTQFRNFPSIVDFELGLLETQLKATAKFTEPKPERAMGGSILPLHQRERVFKRDLEVIQGHGYVLEPEVATNIIEGIRVYLQVEPMDPGELAKVPSVVADTSSTRP